MKIEKISPIYKSTFNTRQNPNNKNNNNKQKNKNNSAVILEISSEGRKKLNDDYER